MYVLLHEQVGPSPVPICRLCGTQSSDLSYLDLMHESSRFVMISVEKYLNVEIDEKDTFTKSVCQSCTLKIEDWSSYYDKCQAIQSLIRSTQEQLTINKETANTDEPLAPDSLNPNVVDDTVSQLVEQLAGHQIVPAATESKYKIEGRGEGEPEEAEDAEDAGDDVGEDEDPNYTEDEFEDEMDSEDDEEEGSDGEGGEEGGGGDSPEKKKTASKKQPNLRHKKFTFTVQFLESKVNRKFTAVERIKLQKHITKRQNTLIYEMLIGGGPNQLWECQICNKTLKGRSGEVKKHYVKVHQSQPVFPCHVCDYTSRTEKMYQAHRMSHLVILFCISMGLLEILTEIDWIFI